jgi:hydrogenase nickel incorporation protein HypA/HybF
MVESDEYALSLRDPNVKHLPFFRGAAMHEISVALSLLKIIEKQCQEKGYLSIESVKVKVGKAGGVLPEAFAFAFEIAKKDTLAQNARFVVELVPLGGFCNGCQKQFETEEVFVFACPLCDSPSFQINQGYELELVEIDVES